MPGPGLFHLPAMLSVPSGKYLPLPVYSASLLIATDVFDRTILVSLGPEAGPALLDLFLLLISALSALCLAGLSLSKCDLANKKATKSVTNYYKAETRWRRRNEPNHDILVPENKPALRSNQKSSSLNFSNFLKFDACKWKKNSSLLLLPHQCCHSSFSLSLSLFI